MIEYVSTSFTTLFLKTPLIETTTRLPNCPISALRRTRGHSSSSGQNLGNRIEALTYSVRTIWASPRMLGAALAPKAVLFTSGHRLPDCPGVIGHTDINCPGIVEV